MSASSTSFDLAEDTSFQVMSESGIFTRQYQGELLALLRFQLRYRNRASGVPCTNGPRKDGLLVESSRRTSRAHTKNIDPSFCFMPSCTTWALSCIPTVRGPSSGGIAGIVLQTNRMLRLLESFAAIFLLLARLEIRAEQRMNLTMNVRSPTRLGRAGYAKARPPRA
jgi:hypothetical protein